MRSLRTRAPRTWYAHGTASRYSISGMCRRNACSTPMRTVMTVLEQLPQTPVRRTWATPSALPSPSTAAPSSSKAGPTPAARTFSTRCFKSRVSTAGLLSSACHGPRPFHVRPQLLHKVVHARERPGVAEPLEHVHRQLLAVQIPLEADQVNLQLAG